MDNWNSSNFLIPVFLWPTSRYWCPILFKKSNSSFRRTPFFHKIFFSPKNALLFFPWLPPLQFFFALNYFFDIYLCSFQVAFDLFPTSLYECLFQLIFQVINCIKRVSVNRWTKLYTFFKIKMPCEQFLQCHVFLILIEGVEKLEKSFILIVFQSNTFFVE